MNSLNTYLLQGITKSKQTIAVINGLEKSESTDYSEFYFKCCCTVEILKSNNLSKGDIVLIPGKKKPLYICVDNFMRPKLNHLLNIRSKVA